MPGTALGGEAGVTRALQIFLEGLPLTFLLGPPESDGLRGVSWLYSLCVPNETSPGVQLIGRWRSDLQWESP